MSAAAVCVFDLNGTLLDMAALDPAFRRVFGKAGVRKLWFGRLQAMWMTDLACGTYRPFDALARSALRAVAAEESAVLSSAAEREILGLMTELPAFPDVRPALGRLAAGGVRHVALTNGTRKSAKRQVKFAGLAEALGEVYSAEAVKRYKPAPEPYRYVAGELGVKPKKLLLVAAHDWDVAGAAAAGLRTAFVARPGQALDPDGGRPDYRARDLGELAGQLL